MLNELSTRLADAVAAAASSVVQVHGRKRPASGLVYADDVVVTTTRAIGRDDGLHVRRHDGDTLPAELVGWDPATSLAVLRVASLRAPALAPSKEDPRVGHLALAVARSWSNAVTASAGIIAVIGGPLPTGRRRGIETVIRTTAPMHDGFAGGAFLSATGGLIGIATAATIRGFGVIIPATIAWNAATTLLEHGSLKRGYLGVRGQPVMLAAQQRGTDDRARALLVVGVTPEGPATEAGVLVGDIVVALDAEPIESPEDLLNVLLEKPSGQVVTLRVLRGAQALDVAVTLGERPDR
jgi:S1-C subfamily serine protease